MASRWILSSVDRDLREEKLLQVLMIHNERGNDEKRKECRLLLQGGQGHTLEKHEDLVSLSVGRNAVALVKALLRAVDVDGINSLDQGWWTAGERFSASASSCASADRLCLL